MQVSNIGDFNESQIRGIWFIVSFERKEKCGTYAARAHFNYCGGRGLSQQNTLQPTAQPEALPSPTASDVTLDLS